MTMDNLIAPVAEHYALYQAEYKRLTNSKAPMLDEVEAYLAGTPGKQLRPLLLMLSAQACNNLKPTHATMAAAVELVHNASLMHDDVIDESDSRRGTASVRGRWGNQTAVLCGDYYLTQVMAAMEKVDNPEATRLLNDTVATMCIGELKQLKAVSSQAVTVDTYLDIIGSKTASLMALCCQLGALEAKEKEVEALRHYGHHYGIVFQLRDDLANLNVQHDVALPSGISPTPLIHTHTHSALAALNTLPDTPAKIALAGLLAL